MSTLFRGLPRSVGPTSLVAVVVALVVGILVVNYMGINTLFGKDISLLDDVSALAFGGGAGESGGVVKESADTFQADQHLTVQDDQAVAAFDPDQNELPYNFDTHSLSEDARTFPYN